MEERKLEKDFNIGKDSFFKNITLNFFTYSIFYLIFI